MITLFLFVTESIQQCVTVTPLIMLAVTSDDEIDVGKHVLGLHELAGVSLVEQVVDAVCVDADGPRHLAGLGLLVGDALRVVTSSSLRVGVSLVRERSHAVDRLRERERCD